MIALKIYWNENLKMKFYEDFSIVMTRANALRNDYGKTRSRACSDCSGSMPSSRCYCKGETVIEH